MNGLLHAANEVQAFCEQHQWRFCFVGGLAVQRWGEPRVTLDVDITLMTGFGSEERFLEPLLDRFPERITDARDFAHRNRVLLLKTTDEVGIDVLLGALPFEDSMVDRASVFSFAADIKLRTCSAEDLIVLKLFASRPLDLRDAESVAIRNKKDLDWQYIEGQLRPLSKLREDLPIMAKLDELRKL